MLKAQGGQSKCCQSLLGSSLVDGVPDTVLSELTLTKLPIHSLGIVTMVCVKLLKCANVLILKIAGSMLLNLRAKESPASLVFAIRVMKSLPYSIMARRDYQSQEVSDASEFKVKSFGCGSHGQLGHPCPQTGPCYLRREPQKVVDLCGEHVVQVAAGFEHTLVLTQDGKVFGFGNAINGELGHGNPCKYKQYIPYKAWSLDDENIVQVAAGAHHSVVLTACGEVFTFGSGCKGKLGHGCINSEYSPRKVHALVGKNIIQVAAGSGHTVVLADNGDVFAFGNVPGNSQTTPYKVESLSGERVVQVAAGDEISAALTSHGEVIMFGVGCYLKNVLLEKKNMFAVKMPAGEHIVQVALGAEHFAFVTHKGKLFTFGKGHTGRLGHDLEFIGHNREVHEADLYFPKQVDALRGIHVKQVALGGDHSVALTKGGRVYTFGRSHYGQLGHGLHAGDYECPPRIMDKLLHDRVFQIAAGGDHTLVLCRPR